jgi:hypothetical protein
MTNIQENLGLVIGSIIAALGFILGYVLQSGVLNTLVGVAIGAGITYYVQTKTQKTHGKENTQSRLPRLFMEVCILKSKKSYFN